VVQPTGIADEYFAVVVKLESLVLIKKYERDPKGISLSDGIDLITISFDKDLFLFEVFYLRKVEEELVVLHLSLLV
jgi:hypothetical protein